MNNTLPCIVCRTELNPALDGLDNQPYAATAFNTRGHYGSTFWDPLDGTMIEINVCDPCLVAASQRNAINILHSDGSLCSRMPPVFETGQS